MKLGIIGQGPWALVYAQTLRRIGVEFWQIGRGREIPEADGVVVASSAESHCEIAEMLIWNEIPTLVEKPVCLNGRDARMLLDLAKASHAIVFTGHTRLYSTAWREFKARAAKQSIRSVTAVAGGPCKLEPLWDWGPHLVAMCLDIGFDPLAAKIITQREEHPLTFIANGKTAYIDRPADTPRPLEVLLTEFIAAIEKGDPDIRGLELGVKVVEALEAMEAADAYACATHPDGTYT